MNKLLLSALTVLLGCVFGTAQENKPLKILDKPIPQLTEKQKERDIEAQGTVTLLVQFLANGQIGEIKPVSGLPLGLTENAVEAAEKIKFEPAVKDTQNIMVSKMVQYSFKHGWLKASDQSENKGNAISKLDEKAEEIIKKAIQNLGGNKYLQVKTQIGRGRFSQLQGGALINFQSFVDVVVFPDKERTEFKNNGVRTVQINTGNSGWIFDGAAEAITDQTAKQIEQYKRGMRVSLDNLLRGGWRGDGVLSYSGKRPGTLGKRNDILKLSFADGYVIEFEFTDEGIPVKAIYKQTKDEATETKEEDRYAQFADIDGIKTPFIIDHFSDGIQTSRINYESVEINKKVSDSIFTKPKNVKDAKKEVKF